VPPNEERISDVNEIDLREFADFVPQLKNIDTEKNVSQNFFN